MPRARCAYREDHHGRVRQCPRTGTGNPPICRAHREQIERGDPERSALGDLLGRFVSGKRVSQADIADAVSEVFAGVKIPFPIPGASPRIRMPPFPGAARPPPPPPPPSPADLERERRTAAWVRAKRVFGWGNDLFHPDVESIKKRHRELARQHHPDRGGSTAKMQEINEAMDILMAEVG